MSKTAIRVACRNMIKGLDSEGRDALVDNATSMWDHDHLDVLLDELDRDTEALINELYGVDQ
jgi:hypothetical protein